MTLHEHHASRSAIFEITQFNPNNVWTFKNACKTNEDEWRNQMLASKSTWNYTITIKCVRLHDHYINGIPVNRRQGKSACNLRNNRGKQKNGQKSDITFTMYSTREWVCFSTTASTQISGFTWKQDNTKTKLSLIGEETTGIASESNLSSKTVTH